MGKNLEHTNEPHVSSENLKQFKGRSMTQETVHRLFKNKGAIDGHVFSHHFSHSRYFVGVHL